MERSNGYKVNTPKVTHETIDNEAVILNLDTGSYYSISQSGATIWGLLDRGVPVAEIVKTVARTYDGDFGEIENAVHSLVEKLAEEGLIVPANGTEMTALTEPEIVTRAAERPPFEFPDLHKYTDMEDLLLIDPIHDVDEAGWPNKAAEDQ